MNNDGSELEYFFVRQLTYDLLRRLFIEEPTPELLLYLRESGLPLLVSGHQQPAMANALAFMQADLSARKLKQGVADYENVHWDFTRLFIGPETLPAPPWESAYLSSDHVLFQQCTQDVKNIYQQNAFFLPDNEIEAADHIGYELDFIWNLSEKITASLEHDLQLTDEINGLLHTSADFIESHLLTFITPFCQQISSQAETPFYQQLSHFLEAFLRHDLKQLHQFMNL